MVESDYDLIDGLLLESKNYRDLENFEKLVDEGGNLTQIPIQPAFVALKSLTPSEVALYLPKFSKEQRVRFLDIDWWDKDQVSTESCEFWLQAYTACSDYVVRKEFLTSEHFLLFFQARFNIWTFDYEDPSYPDHDCYFLTDDNQFLVEYDENFAYVDLLKHSIGELYDIFGVEGAYTYLFKLISGSFLIYQEEEYQRKKFRLAEIGMPDYFDSLEQQSTLPSIAHVNALLKTNLKRTPKVSSMLTNQTLPHKTLVSFIDKSTSLHAELSKLKDEKRSDYLRVNFVRFFNANISFFGDLSSSMMALKQIGERSQALLTLGLDYVNFHKENLSLGENSIFMHFDFSDLYKIGNSLIRIELNKLKKCLSIFKTDSDEAFLGDTINLFLDSAFEQTSKLNWEDTKKSQVINSYSEYLRLKELTDLVVQLAPFIRKFLDLKKELISSEAIQDSYYLNYSVVEIDFESMMISTLINDYLGLLSTQEKKMGVTIDELVNFVTEISLDDHNFILKLSVDFSTKFGLGSIAIVEEYLTKIIEENLIGYDFQQLPRKDFKHIGGVILLA